MVQIILTVNGSSATTELSGKLTSGMVGIPVSIKYDDSWSNLTKTVSFKAGNFVRSRINVGTSTTVPWEVMRHFGKRLEVGVEGRDSEGNIVIPTVWATASTIHKGAVSGVPGAPNPDAGEIPSGGAVIDDSQISENTTWSSKKISDEINGTGGGGTAASGTTFYPSVSADGVISWTNDGNKENPAPVDLVNAVISALPVYNGEVEPV